MQTADGGADGTADARDSVAFVRFRLGGFPLALEAGHVERVLGTAESDSAGGAASRGAPLPEWTRLPGTPAPVVGLSYATGTLTPIVSLADRLDIDPEDTDGKRRVVVVRAANGPPVGLLADGTSGLRTTPVDRVVPPAASDGFFLGGAAEDPLFRAVVTFDEGTAYALAPGQVVALAAGGDAP